VAAGERKNPRVLEERIQLTRNRLSLLLLAAAVAALTVTALATGARNPAKVRAFGAVHGDVTAIKRNGTTTSFSFDRGTIMAASSSSVTLQRADGRSLTFSLANARVRGELRVGRQAVVFTQNGAAVQVFTGAANAAKNRRRGDRNAKRRQHLAGLRAGAQRLLAGAVHVDYRLLLRNGTTRTLALDRGTITAASASSLSLKRADGPTVTFSLGSSTKVRGTIAVNARALVVSQNGTALRVLTGRRSR
jgi:hypothetical protein